MKLVHSDKTLQSVEEMLALARQHEQDDEKEEAIALYLKILRRQPRNEKIYDRLMILYRKTRQPQKEMDIIESGIKAFEEFYSKKIKGPTFKNCPLKCRIAESDWTGGQKREKYLCARTFG